VNQVGAYEYSSVPALLSRSLVIDVYGHNNNFKSELVFLFFTSERLAFHIRQI
jgi:hypothetical protein